MILHLEQGVVFVGDGRVVYVDEAVGAAGEEETGGGVELQVCDVVVVAFGVGLDRLVRGAGVPVFVSDEVLLV